MEMAGLRSPLNESADVTKAINKNKAALTAAIKKRLANEEDMDAHDAVESLLIKTAIEAGLPKDFAENHPWMETYAVPGEGTAAEDLDALQGDLEDMLADPDIMSSGSSKSTKELSGDELIKKLNDAGFFEKVAKALDEAKSAYITAAGKGVYLVGGGYHNIIKTNIVEPVKGLSTIYTSTKNVYAVRDGDKMFAVFCDYVSEGKVTSVVEVKSDKGIESIQDNTTFTEKLQQSGIEKGDPYSIQFDYSIFRILGRDNFDAVNDAISEELSDALGNIIVYVLPMMNPAITGAAKIPDFSQIQSQVGKAAKAGEPVYATSPYGRPSFEVFNAYSLPSSGDTKSLVNWMRNTIKAIADKSVNESIFEQIVKVIGK